MLIQGPHQGPTIDTDVLERVRQSRHAAPDATTLVLPVWSTLLDDQLTPVLAYRRLVAPDERQAPSFLFESVEGGERQGRHSVLGAQPILEVIAHAHQVQTIDHRPGAPKPAPPVHLADPLELPRQLTRGCQLIRPAPSAANSSVGRRLPNCFLGGWVGFAAYDSVRYAEPEKLGWLTAPLNDRALPDLHFALYDGVVIFDHVDKIVYIVRLVQVPAAMNDRDIENAFDLATQAVERRIQLLAGTPAVPPRTLTSGRLDAPPTASGAGPGAAKLSPIVEAHPVAMRSNLSKAQHAVMLARAKEYIKAGDIFQVVLGQRFEKSSHADPFDVYRALRAVNPSPYMVYLQGAGCILIASSPEILCRVRREPLGMPEAPRVVTNRPLAGTRKRGSTPEQDKALERELLSDPKELAEHIMLVDLGRNDVGKVAVPGTITLPSLMSIERYSHVMHISSTVTGELRPELDCWDALRAALPVGTISGAPKVRAMQIIDELEPIRRGPYGGGIGYVGFDGEMDIALALRTIVVPVNMRQPDGTWTYHLQASGGIVADSAPEDEYQETINKAAALERAINTAESAFPVPGPERRAPRI